MEYAGRRLVEGRIFDRFLYKLPELSNWLANNDQVLWWLAVSSILVFVASLVLIPWLIVRIPADYFHGEQRSTLSTVLRGRPVLIAIFAVLRNAVAIVFVVLGLLLLVLPGQGLLTIFLGVVIADFPGKHKAVNWLVAHRSIHRPINWLRRKAGRPPIQPPPLNPSYRLPRS